MKTKKYYLVLAVVISILCIWVPAKRGPSALGQIELPLNHDEPFLIGRAHPELAGIDKLRVGISRPDLEPNKDGLLWKELEAKVKQRVKEVGIKIAPGSSKLAPPDVSQLSVYIDMLKLRDLQQYVLHIQTSVLRPVYLARELKSNSTSEPELILRAYVWKKRRPMLTVSVQHMPAVVTGVVLKQVEAFVAGWLAANPQGAQLADVNDTTVVSATTSKGVSKGPAKQTTAEHRYVASKNSEVFHNPECRWAKKISSRNLVGYNSTDEATQAGKRPCKLCKP